MSGRILIAEDEDRIATFIQKGLRANGFATTVTADGAGAYALARSAEFDLLLLDIGLPDEDGLRVLGRLRSDGVTIPVIILTARDEIADRVAGLESGADDYLGKPFAFDELLARIRLRLRGELRTERTTLQCGDITLDLRTRRATAGSVVVELSAREFALAELFLRHPDQVLTREQILSHVWGLDFDPGSNVVDVYVRYLRRKLGPDAIRTVRGMGYRLRDGQMRKPS